MEIIEATPNAAEEPMTAEQAYEWLKLAVEERGAEFVYYPETLRQAEQQESSYYGVRCYYLPQTDLAEDDPRMLTGCVVGTAMKLAGREVTESCESYDPSDLNETWNLSNGAVRVLSAAQRAQDRDATWGESLELASEALVRV